MTCAMQEMVGQHTGDKCHALDVARAHSLSVLAVSSVFSNIRVAELDIGHACSCWPVLRVMSRLQMHVRLTQIET